MATPKIDVEGFLYGDLLTFLQANLNTAIAAVDTDKNDGITTEQIDSGAYFVQSMNDKEAAYPQLCFLGVVDIPSTFTGPGIAEDWIIHVMVQRSDDGTDPLLTKKMFRYGRALKELFCNSFKNLRIGVTIRIKSLTPARLTDLNTSETSRVVGVELQVTVA